MSAVPGHISFSSNSGYSTTTSQQQQGTSKVPVSEVGGYDVNFVDRANSDYQCPICQFTFRDPVQTRDCGHRFCETCLEPILRYCYTLQIPNFDPITIINVLSIDNSQGF